MSRHNGCASVPLECKSYLPSVESILQLSSGSGFIMESSCGSRKWMAFQLLCLQINCQCTKGCQYHKLLNQKDLLLILLCVYLCLSSYFLYPMCSPSHRGQTKALDPLSWSQKLDIIVSHHMATGNKTLASSSIFFSYLGSSADQYVLIVDA